MEDICKVCRLGVSDDRPLFHPCRCTGSIRYVHQDCLMQWLRHSGKEYCELCHHKFQFASVYRHDMPKWIPFRDIYHSIVKNVLSKFGRWFQFGFVIFMWLFLVPIITYRIYKCLIYSSIWSLLLLPLNIFTMDSIVLDSIFGLVIVVLSLLGFISLVWLKDQFVTGDNPNWLVADFDNAKKVDQEEKIRILNLKKETISLATTFSRTSQNALERQNLNRDLKHLEATIDYDLKVAEDIAYKWNHEECALLRVKEMTLMYDLGMSTVQYQPLLRTARFKNIEAVENWKNKILDRMRAEGKIPPNIHGLPTPAAIVVRETPLPSLRELGLTLEESEAFKLFNRLPHPPVDGRERQTMIDELHHVQTNIKENAMNYVLHQQTLTRALLSSDMDGTNNSSIDKLREDCNFLTEKINREVTMIEDANVEVRRLYPEAYLRDITWYERLLGRNNVQEEIRRRPERHEGQQNQQQDPQQQRIRRPNIGQALVGLAREPQDANAEAIQADQLMRMIGLDGSFRFLEHVIWLTVLVSMIIFTFVYIPFVIGSSVAWVISLWEKIGIENWQTLSSVLFGYCLILAGVVLTYYTATAVNIYRIKPALGIIYLALKICLLLLLEAGIFPLLCGWWIDICAFSLLGSNLKTRESNLNSAPGTIMFLHWLAGMIYVFYFASLVVLLREIIRPGVLWFLRNLNDQNFHPIQDMISQPFQRHMRRFLMSNIMFGVSIMLVILIPSHIAIYILPGFLPYNLTLISSVSPIKEIQLELILLQFVIPTLLEHSNSRLAMKKFVTYWTKIIANLLGLQSYLLDGPQTGGNVVDIHGNPIRHIEYDPTWEGPVYIGDNQTLGPGYAPFKPYLRPKYFQIRVITFVILVISTVLGVSTFLLVVPIFTGRYVMFIIGITSPPDVYTASIGIYVLWILGKTVSPLVSGCSRGDVYALVNHITVWIKQGLKCIIAGVLLFVAIPLLLGHFVNLIMISPLRVPVHKTPLFYLTTEWALGLLHMKCACGIIWLTDTSFKRTLDTMYQNGARNIRLTFIIREIVSPVVCNLILCLAIPYGVLMGIIKHLGLLSATTCYAVYRYCYPVVLLFLVTLVIILVVFKQTHNLYTGIKNEKYLIGRQLKNFGSFPSSEISTLSTPVEETREQ